MLKIGDFSKLSCISIRMLRYYDKQNMLKPSYIDEDTGYRFYEVKQLEEANMLLKLRSLDFSNKVIKELLKDKNQDNIDYYFGIRIKEIGQELERISRLSMELSQMVKVDYNRITYNVTKKTIPKRKVASFRTIVSNYMNEKQLWDILYQELEQLGIESIHDHYAMAIFHDSEYKDKDVDIEVQVTVDQIYKDTDIIHFFETELIEVASVTFNGSYDKMTEVTKSALLWIEFHNYELMQPTFNIYHISPAQDENPDNWVTESCFIIKERNEKHG